MDGDSLTLDQLRVFRTVAETGSFSAAARKLHRAQSAVSYAIGNLETNLGVTLFDRTSRKPTLTTAGRALLIDANQVYSETRRLLTRARGLAESDEPEVSVAIDGLYPMAALVDVVKAFQSRYPQVALRIRTEVLGMVSQLVETGACTIGISSPLPKFPSGIAATAVGETRLVAVASKNHPLAQHTGPIPMGEFQRFVQIVISDRSQLTAGVDHGVISARTWRVADISTKHAFLMAAFGWGTMPEHVIADDVANGSLKRIYPADRLSGETIVPLHSVVSEDRPPGPAALWLLERLSLGCSEDKSLESPQAG